MTWISLAASRATGLFKISSNSMRLRASPYLLLVVTALCWSGNHILARAVHGDVPPMAMAFWRWVVAVVVLLPFVVRGLWVHRAIIRQHWRMLVLLAAVGLSLNHGFLYLALNSTTAINVGLITAIAPIMIPLVAFALDREVIKLQQLIGIMISLAGVMIIITRADADILLGLRFTPGDLYAVVTPVAWAVYSVLLKRLPVTLPPMVFMMVISIMGAALLLPFYGWEVEIVGGFALNAANILTLLYMGVFPSLIAYIFWNQGVARIGASKAGPFNYLIPVFTVGLAVLLLGEVVRVYHAAGAVLTVIGIYLTTSARRPAPE